MCWIMHIIMLFMGLELWVQSVVQAEGPQGLFQLVFQQASQLADRRVAKQVFQQLLLVYRLL
jgi:hypothetical protein